MGLFMKLLKGKKVGKEKKGSFQESTPAPFKYKLKECVTWV